MNKLAQIIVMASVVCVANGGWNPIEILIPKRSSPVDFEGLEKLMVKNVPYGASSGANLQYVKANIDTMEGPVRKAAVVLLELIDLKENYNKCDKHELSLIHEVAEAGLYLDGVMRIEDIMTDAGLLTKLNQCSLFVGDTSRQLETDPQFVRYISKMPTLYKRPGKKSKITKEARDEIVSFIKQLSKDDPQGQPEGEQKNESTDGQKFDYALGTYVVEPCKQFLADPRLDYIINSCNDIWKIGCEVGFLNDVKIIYRLMNSRKLICMDYINMDASTRAKLFSN